MLFSTQYMKILTLPHKEKSVCFKMNEIESSIEDEG